MQKFGRQITINAVQPSYKLVFHSNNDLDTEETENQSFTYGTAQNLKNNTFTKTGYHFINWTTNADGTGTSYDNEEEVNNLPDIDDSTIDLYAQWKENMVVTFDSNGGTIPEGDAWNGSGSTANKHIKSSTYGTMPEPTKMDYTFIRWSPLPNQVTNRENHTLYAIWGKE